MRTFILALCLSLALAVSVKAFDYKQPYTEGYRFGAMIGPVFNLTGGEGWLLFKVLCGYQYDRNIYLAFTMGINIFGPIGLMNGNYSINTRSYAELGLISAPLALEFKYNFTKDAVSPYVFAGLGPAISFYSTIDNPDLSVYFYSCAGGGLRITMDYYYDIIIEVSVPSYNLKFGTVTLTAGVMGSWF